MNQPKKKSRSPSLLVLGLFSLLGLDILLIAHAATGEVLLSIFLAATFMVALIMALLFMLAAVTEPLRPQPINFNMSMPMPGMVMPLQANTFLTEEERGIYEIEKEKDNDEKT